MILASTCLMLLLVFIVIWLNGTNQYVINEQKTYITQIAGNIPCFISEGKIDTEYFRIMTLYFLALRFNVFPEIVDSNHDFLLTFVNPDIYVEYKSVLRDEAARVKIHGEKSVFHLTDINIYPDNGRVDVSGVIKVWIGHENPLVEAKNYQLYLTYIEGVIGIVEFNETTDKIN